MRYYLANLTAISGCAIFLFGFLIPAAMLIGIGMVIAGIAIEGKK